MRTAFTRVLGRRRTLVLLLLAVLLASTTAWAFWAAKSSGSASGHVGGLPAPQISSATPGGGTVTLNWTTVSAPASGTVSYYVSRDGGAASAACPSASSPSTQTSCTDMGVSISKHTYTVTAVWRSWTAASAGASAQVSTGPATHLLLAPATTTPIAGVNDNLTITALDASNNKVTSYAGARTVTFSGAGSAGPSQPTVTNASGTAVAFGSAETINFSNGEATVTGSSNGVMTLYKAETAKITVSDGTLNNGTGVSVTVAPASATGFTVPTPSSQTAGTAFNQTLTAVDQYGNTATAYAGTRAITFSGPGSSPNSTSPKYPATVKFTSGVSESFGVTLYKAETTALTAKEGSVSGSSGSFNVGSASAKSLTLVNPGAQTAGTAFEDTITAKDEYGNTATSYPGTKTITFSGPSSSPNSTSPKYPAAVKFSGGVSEGFSITLYKAETPILKATDGSISGSVSFTVAAAAASKLTVPTPPTQTAGKEFSEALTALDAYGNTATSFAGPRTITFTGPTTSPDGHAPKYPASVNFASGEGTASITIYDAGSMTLTAEEGSVSGKSGSFTVNGLSTTSKFLLSTPSPTAGTQFTETVTASDLYGNTTTSYAGSHTLAFKGPSKSPNFTSPKYPAGSTTFTAGVGSPTITLYAAQTTALEVSASGVEGASEPFTVASASPASLSVTTPGTQTAGVPFTLTITGAKDAYGNTVGGTQSIGFANPSSAPDGTTPSYPTTATFSGGEAKPSVTLSDAQTTTIKATSGSGSATTSSFTVNSGPMSALALSAASATVIAGEGDELTIKAVDSFENTVTSYPSSKNLKFAGAKVNGTKSPTVTNSAGAATAFGSTTAITFTNGVAKVSGTSNGLMRLYALETGGVTVSDGTFTSAALPVTVEAALISSLTLINGNFGSSAKGKVESGDSFAVEFNSPIAVNSMCSAWTGNGTNHALTGNSEVTVTLTDGTGATDDMLTVSSSKCTFHLGNIDLGSNAYVSGGGASFGGTGSNKSVLEYKAASHTLEVELGTKSGSGTIGKVSSSAATFTPDANLADEFGNVFPGFTTTTTAQF
jgi:hypothetical protein